MPSIALAIVRRQLDERYAKMLVHFARETGHAQPERFQSKLPGDTRALRGIPAIGPGVTGAIPGTSPHRTCND